MPKQRIRKKQVLKDLQTAKLVAGDDHQAAENVRETTKEGPRVESLVVLVRVRGEKDQQVILAKETEISIRIARLARDAAYPGRAAVVDVGGRIFRLGKPGTGYVNTATSSQVVQIS